MTRNGKAILLSVSMYVYLISRFLFITAQTKEFPTILVIMKIDVTVVTATSVDLGMIGVCQCQLLNLDKKQTYHILLNFSPTGWQKKKKCQSQLIMSLYDELSPLASYIQFI